MEQVYKKPFFNLQYASVSPLAVAAPKTTPQRNDLVGGKPPYHRIGDLAD